MRLLKISGWLSVTLLIVVGCRRQYTGVNPLRIVVPLNIVYDPTNNYAPTPTVQIKLGGGDSSFTVLFDTGSPGLRILKGAIDHTYYQQTNTVDTGAYGTPPFRFTIVGKVAKASFSVGSLTTASPISIMAIAQAQYDTTAPFTSTGDSAIIGGRNFKHLCGILGVGMRSAADGVVSPLAQLPGNSKYIIRFPRYGDTAGSVIINPTVEDVSEFTLFHLSPGSTGLPGGLSSWQDRELYGCFVLNGTPYWAYTFLDTGNPVMEIQSPAFSGYSYLMSGDSVEFGLADSLLAPFRIETGFRIGKTDSAGKDQVQVQHNGGVMMNYPAIMPFFHFEVLYDQADGIIGLKAK